MIVLSRTRRIDWPRMIENLQRLGQSPQHIADRIEVSRSTLRGYLEVDSEPAFWTGTKIIEVWCEATQLTLSDVPTRTVTPSVSEVLRTTA